MKAVALLLSASLLTLPVLNAQETGKNQAVPDRKAKNEARMLAKFDANHNGVLDPDERAAMEKFKAERKAQRLAKYDKNGDGKLEKSEKAAMRAEHPGKGKGKHNDTAGPATSGTNSAVSQ